MTWYRVIVPMTVVCVLTPSQASSQGVIGRLEPGKMFLIDTREGRIVDDAELKQKITTAQPYREWLQTYQTRVVEGGRPPLTSGPPPLGAGMGDPPGGASQAAEENGRR